MSSRVATIAALALAVPAAVAADDIGAVRDRYLAAASAGDAAAMAELFADDAVMVTPDDAHLRGRAQIEKYFADMFAQSVSSPALTFLTASAESAEGFGSETGRFEQRLTSAEGAAARTAGTYVLIYRQDAGGDWRIAIEIRITGAATPLR